MNTHIEVFLLSLVILLIVVALTFSPSVGPLLAILLMSVVETIMFAVWIYSE
jgi:hypothetical protein